MKSVFLAAFASTALCASAAPAAPVNVADQGAVNGALVGQTVWYCVPGDECHTLLVEAVRGTTIKVRWVESGSEGWIDPHQVYTRDQMNEFVNEGLDQSGPPSPAPNDGG